MRSFSVYVSTNKRLHDFSVYVSNSSNISHHVDICAYHPGFIPAAGNAELPCNGTKVARYLSVIVNTHRLHYGFFLCEAVVIGALAIGM